MSISYAIRFPVGTLLPNQTGNKSDDVKKIQHLLRSAQKLFSMAGANFSFYSRSIVPTGSINDDTKAAIRAYQKNVLRLSTPDGRVDPQGRTFFSLCEAARQFQTQVDASLAAHKVRQYSGKDSTVSSASPTLASQETTSTSQPATGVGINPITGTSGFNPHPVGTTGHLREQNNGRGEFKAPRMGGRLHRGLDIRGVLNQSPIYAHRDGKVVFHGVKGKGGNQITIDHGDVSTVYCHCSNTDFRKWVKSGQQVKQGQQIATIGDTGNAKHTPPHLHFGVFYKGRAIDPAQYLNGVAPAKCNSI